MGEDLLSLDNIMDVQGIDSLFGDSEDVAEEPSAETSAGQETEESEKETTETESAGLFEGDENLKSESVGRKEQEGNKGDTSTDTRGGASSNDFYSSIANALAVDGIFLNLDEEKLSKVTDADGFGDLVEAEVSARVESQLDDAQKRILQALENGVESSDIRKYEGTLNYLDSLSEAAIAEESEKGEQLRRNLIFQDYLNKGIDRAKAQKLTERAIDAGTDLEDAKEALQSNRDYFTEAYHKLLDEAQARADADKKERKAQADKLKDAILKEKSLMGDIDISQDVRKKVLDNITKPVYKDPETGAYLTALQKYEMEHRSDFLKYAGLLFTLTNGFKDFDTFTKGKVKKEVRKGLRELEQSLNNTRRDSRGSLRMVTNVKDDPESFIGSNFKLAL